MSLVGETRFLERLQFFNGQRLLASDLQAVEEFDREMRWLHNQSLHQPGVGIGYAVIGKKGARGITVEPGYAIDYLGREIVLTETKTLTVPPTAGNGNGEAVFYDLTVAYPDERDLEESETREGICLPRGVVRRREEPVFCWVELGPAPQFQPENGDHKRDIEQGKSIHLARAEVLHCQLNKPLSDAKRRSARPLNQPYVACGSTAGEPWEVTSWQQFGLRIQQHVDTSSAGFRTGPCYCAHVAGDRVFELPFGDVPIDGFTSISQTTAAGFLISLLIPGPFLEMIFRPGLESIEVSESEARKNFGEWFEEQIFKNGWHVEWIGIEG